MYRVEVDEQFLYISGTCPICLQYFTEKFKLNGCNGEPVTPMKYNNPAHRLCLIMEGMM